jgi:putative ABC transport system permease protein
MEQKRAGRFPRPVNNRVTPVVAWMREQQIVPKEATAMMVVSLLFLLVCSLNLMGLLLGKFLARAPEIGVRRALGARRIDVFVQHLVECELVGVVGGANGLGLSVAGLVFLNRWAALVTTRTDLFRLDLSMTLLALGLSLLAGLVAGAYPAWRVCRIPPALHLKIQ